MSAPREAKYRFDYDIKHNIETLPNAKRNTKFKENTRSAKLMMFAENILKMVLVTA